MAFVVVYLVSFLVVISFEEWFVVWMGLEINLFMFVVLIYDRMSEDSVESAFKYFFIQSMSSALLMIGMYMGMLVDVVLVMKMGIGPFFFWYLSVVSGMGWVENFFLMILQKILPFFLLSMVWGSFMWMMVLVSMLLGAMGGLLESSMKGLMAYSSMNHMGWVLLSQSYSSILWIEYMLFYGLFIFLLFLYFYSEKVEMMIELQMSSWVMLIVFLVSLSGIPPLVGFFLKVIILMSVIEISMMMGFIVLVVSLLMFFVYFRIFYKMMMLDGDVMMKLELKNKVKNYFLMEMILLFIFFFI